MVFRSFRFRVVFRILLLCGLLASFLFMLNDPDRLVTAIVIGLSAVISIIELFRFVERTNRRLTHFLESVRYSDFASGFAADNKLGGSFKELNTAFNEVLEAFRKARSEKEEHWQYLNTVVEQVGTGLISFGDDGNIELVNAVAKRYLRTPQIHNLSEIKQHSEPLFQALYDIKPGTRKLLHVDPKTQLSIHATRIVLRKESFKLITMQNIQSELQEKEIEAWQNLTRVLRHEIMNSITPIASLTSTMRDILIEDIEKKNDHYLLGSEVVEDLQDGLDTIEGRSKGLIRFIDAYRDYTTIPEPNLTQVRLNDLLDHISSLLKVEIRKSGVAYKLKVNDPDVMLNVDEELMEQVLINLVKNAIEAVNEQSKPEVLLSAHTEDSGQIIIRVRDNGEGILPEAQERIFIPFYTTKKSGSGIGLALSRQIMQLHNGTLTVESVPEDYTEFTLKFEMT